MGGWPYNTRQWRRLRELHLSREPFCRFCARLGATEVATVVDHIVPVRKDRAGAFDGANLQSLCETCHNGAKATEESRGEEIGCDVDGNPNKGWD